MQQFKNIKKIRNLTKPVSNISIPFRKCLEDYSFSFKNPKDFLGRLFINENLSDQNAKQKRN